eukprot:COSAG05_NODE_2934_length_2489_cov_2.459414_4_plen_125_part_00
MVTQVACDSARLGSNLGAWGGGNRYIQNVILKINCKLGGINSTLVHQVNLSCAWKQRARTKYLIKCIKISDVHAFWFCMTQLPKMEQPTIVFGADVTHAGAGDSTQPSIAALVRVPQKQTQFRA